jgi:hypothetical protein
LSRVLASVTNINMIQVIVFITAFIFSLVASAIAKDVGAPCSELKVQAKRSAELREIEKADQADRFWALDPNGAKPSQAVIEKMNKNDLRRRMRVGEIFGEGCLKSVDDYKAAFFVYQHGNNPDQYFQAFVWSRQALSLGDDHMKSNVAMAVDRYLVSTEHKQLFGTQAAQISNGCWCIQPIEDSFPEIIRSEYRGGLNASVTGLVYLKILNKGKTCPTSYCDTNLLPTPQGSILGFW